MTKLKDLTNDERCVLATLNSNLGPTTMTVGGEYAESVLCHRAALAMLSLIGRGLVEVKIFNDTGRCEYRPTEAAAPLKGKVSLAFLEQHGRWSLTEPHPFRKSDGHG